MVKDPNKVAAALARAKATPPERRSEIAKAAAVKRWSARPYAATHKGNFFDELGIDIDCYVLDDASKTAVISQRGMGEAIGFSRRGSRLTVFVNSQTMAEYIGRDLLEKFNNPLVFQPPKAAAAGGVAAQPNGYDAALLIDLCQAILRARADGKLTAARYKRMITQAQIIVGASAKNGIRQFVYALAGYSPSTEEVIAAFKLYVLEEAKKYEPEFPNELYLQWHRLYELAVPDRGKPWQFKYLTVNHVYIPLAKSNGKLLDLLRVLKTEGGDRKKKLFQFLNHIGARALRIQLGRVLEMAESSPDKGTYEKKIIERFGGQPDLDFGPNAPSVSPPPSSQSPTAAQE